jgi:hypothetical protein
LRETAQARAHLKAVTNMALVSTMPTSVPRATYDTMNLTAGGVCTVSKEQTSRGWTVRRMATRDTMRLDDIDGAAPYNRITHITKKPDLHNVSDIAGTGSMRLHKDTNKVDMTLKCDDINGLSR